MKGRRGSVRADGLQAIAAGGTAFVLYAATACRTIYTGDSPELSAASACFGVPHPPGYPLYTFLSALWVHLFPAAQRDLASNLASALYGACAVGLMALLLQRLGCGRAAVWFGAATLALGRTFWGQSVATEVYTFDLLLLVVCLHAARQAALSASRRTWFLAGLVLGLWSGHRFINVIFIPGALLVAWALRGKRAAADPRPGSRLRANRLPAARLPVARLPVLPLILGVAAAALPYLYLPIASSADPSIDIGDPERWDRFWTVVTGAPYVRHLTGGTPALAWSRLLRYLAELPVEIGLAAPAAAIALWTLGRRSGRGRRLTLGFLLVAAADVIATSRYNILDIRSYYLPSFLSLCALGAFGADAVLARAARRGGSLGKRWIPACVVVSALAGLPVNLPVNNLSADRYAARFGSDLLASAAADAVLFVQGDTVTHSVWYTQVVEKQAPGVLVISQGHFSPWYFDELQRRYPGEDWPAYDEQRGEMAHFNLLLERLGHTRPIYFSSDPGELARAGPASWWSARTVIPCGLLLEARRRDDPLNRAERARWNSAFWKKTLANLDPVRSHAELETQAIYLEYALALQRTGEFLQRQGLGGEARFLYEQVLRFDPDRCEAELERSYAAIGRGFPRLYLARRARAAIAELGG